MHYRRATETDKISIRVRIEQTRGNSVWFVIVAVPDIFEQDTSNLIAADVSLRGFYLKYYWFNRNFNTSDTTPQSVYNVLIPRQHQLLIQDTWLCLTINCHIIRCIP